MAASDTGYTKNSVLYVGGIDPVEASEAVLHAAFIPFGEIKIIEIPRDGADRARGYAFIEFESAVSFISFSYHRILE